MISLIYLSFTMQKNPYLLSLIYELISVKQITRLVEEMCSKMCERIQWVGTLKATLTWKKQHDWCRFVLVSFTNPFIYDTCKFTSLILRTSQKLKLHTRCKEGEGKRQGKDGQGWKIYEQRLSSCAFHYK